MDVNNSNNNNGTYTFAFNPDNVGNSIPLNQQSVQNSQSQQPWNYYQQTAQPINNSQVCAQQYYVTSSRMNEPIFNYDPFTGEQLTYYYDNNGQLVYSKRTKKPAYSIITKIIDGFFWIVMGILIIMIIIGRFDTLAYRIGL